jgi:hypothetical protein
MPALNFFKRNEAFARNILRVTLLHQVEKCSFGGGAGHGKIEDSAKINWITRCWCVPFGTLFLSHSSAAKSSGQLHGMSV